MHLVGQAMYDAGLHGRVPLVGITAHGAVNGREAFEGVRYGRATYADPAKASFNGAPISPHHSHFLFIDSGKENSKAWGSEIKVRAAIEKHLTMARAVPMVLLVVQGGPGTLQTVLEAAKLGCPVVLLENSGGAATAVCQYIKEGALDPERDKAFEKKLDQMKEIKKINDRSGRKLLSLYDVGNESMATVILRAIVANLSLSASRRTTAANLKKAANQAKEKAAKERAVGTAAKAAAWAAAGIWAAVTSRTNNVNPEDDDAPDALAKALLLAVKWDRPDIAVPILEQLKARSGEQFSPIHRRALQTALALERIDVLRVLFKVPGFETAGLPHVSMSHLYKTHSGAKYLTSSRSLQASMRELSREIEQSKSDEKPEKKHLLYLHLLGPFFSYHVTPALTAFLNSGKETGYADLLFWAAVIGNDALMHEFWARAPANQVTLALLCSFLLRKKSRVITWGQREAAERAVDRESWAFGVLEQIQTDDDARLILGQALPTGPGVSMRLLELATVLEMKTFLSHRHCQGMLEGWWRSDRLLKPLCMLPEQISYGQLLCQALLPLPIFNPYVIIFTSSPKGLSVHDHESKSAVNSQAFQQGMSLAVAMRRRAREMALGQQAGNEGEGSSDRRRRNTKELVDFREAEIRAQELILEELKLAEQRQKQEEQAEQDAMEAEQGILKCVRFNLAFYHVSMTKFMLRFASYCGLVGLYVIVLDSTYDYDVIESMVDADANGTACSSADATPEQECTGELSAALSITIYEILLMVWNLGLLYDDIHQQRILKRMNTKLAQPFSKALRFSNRSVVLAFALRLASNLVLIFSPSAAVPLYVLYSWQICINVIFVVFRLTQCTR